MFVDLSMSGFVNFLAPGVVMADKFTTMECGRKWSSGSEMALGGLPYAWDARGHALHTTSMRREPTSLSGARLAVDHRLGDPWTRRWGLGEARAGVGLGIECESMSLRRHQIVDCLREGGLSLSSD